MTTPIEAYVKRILAEIDGSQQEKQDLYEELIDHLQMSRDDWVKAGLTENEAVEKAIAQFGQSEKVGSQIQAAMYPLRQVFLGVLAVISLLYAYTVYLFELFVEGDAYFLWLLLSVGVSSLLLMIALQVFSSIGRKMIINSALIFHAFIFLLGTAHTTSLAVVTWLIVIASILLIYRTTLVDHDYKVTTNRKLIKGFHLYNITIGIIIISGTLFFLWAFLLFSHTFYMIMLIILIPLVVWIFTYYLQIRLLYKMKLKLALVFGFIPLMIVVLIGGHFIYNLFLVEVIL